MSHDDPAEPLDEGDLVSSVAQLQVGDSVVWDGCNEPRVVRKATFGSRAVVEGPDGGTYQIQPTASGDAPDGRFRNLGYGEIEGLRLVNRPNTSSNRDGHEADWGLDT